MTIYNTPIAVQLFGDYSDKAKQHPQGLQIEAPQQKWSQKPQAALKKAENTTKERTKYGDKQQTSIVI